MPRLPLWRRPMAPLPRGFAYLHGNVVSVHRVGEDARGHYLVLDFVEGASLDALVDEAAALDELVPPPIALRIILDALAGIQAVHEARDASGAPLCILHRDVSPQNVLVGQDGIARITDFGIARSALSAKRTQRQQLLGKLLYLPPEYLAGHPPDCRLDVYSAGVTLWVALAGVEPWQGTSEGDLARRIVSDGLPTLSSTGVRVAPQLEAILARACSPDPDARFPTARAMADAVEHMGRETGWLAAHSEVAQYVARVAGKRFEALRAMIAARSADRRRSIESGAYTPALVRAPTMDDMETLFDSPGNTAMPSPSLGGEEHPLPTRRGRSFALLLLLLAVVFCAGLWVGHLT